MPLQKASSYTNLFERMSIQRHCVSEQPGIKTICMQVLVDNPYRNVHLLIEAYNRMALFHNNKQNVGKCLDLLHQAEDLYNAWLNSNPTFSDEIEMPGESLLIPPSLSPRLCAC